MTELVYKSRRRLTDEQREQRKGIEKERQRLRREEEKAWLKAHKLKKVPPTEEEKAQKRIDHLKEVEEKRREITIKATPAIPLDEVLKMISRIGTEKVSSKTGITEDILKSWVHKVWQPRGKMAETLQEYLKSVKH